jgi:2-oxoisovalerate dehydrogenase E1 component
VPEKPFHVPLGQAVVAREGGDATLVTYGIGVHWAVEEAEFWAARGRSIEVIDLRTLAPWDRETVLGSLRKTNRLLVLHEAQLTCGFGAEVAASIAEAGFGYLDAPPMRVAGLDIPIPFSKTIEAEVYSAKSRLRGAIERLFAY